MGFERKGRRVQASDDVLVALVRLVARNVRLLAALIFIGGLIGAAGSFLIDPVYRAETMLVPSDQLTTSGGSPLAGAFGGSSLLSGFGLGGARASNLLLRELVREHDSVADLLTRKYVDSAGQNRTLAVHLGGRGNESRRQLEPLVVKVLKNHLRVSLDEDSGVMTVAVELICPVLAEAVADSAVVILEDRYSTLVRDHYRRLATFLDDRLGAAARELAAAELKLRDFQIENRLVQGSPSLTYELSRLQRAVELKTQLFRDLSARAEMARLEVYRDLPSLVIISPAIAKPEPVRPSRALIAIGASLIGFLIGLFYLLIRAGRRLYIEDAQREPDLAR